ncbi:hypothetical protein C0992_006008 [Termitomyces sp. T32_za158]|nr:hypothetical protein C0992_006008 [Termitomyces sp. T32_za158]
MPKDKVSPCPQAPDTLDMYAQPYVRHLSGHPRHHRIGGYPPTNNFRNGDHVPATSFIGMPPTPDPQYTPRAISSLCVPLPDAHSSMVASQSSSNFFYDGHQQVPSPNVPRAHPSHYISTTQHAENQTPIPAADVPQFYPQFCTSEQLPGHTENQNGGEDAPIPPLDAPQESSQLSLPTGQSMENSASGCEQSVQTQESVCTDSLPLVPEKKRVTKRKRKMSSSADNDGKRENPAVSAQTRVSTEAKSRKPKKADYDPRQCPYCFKWKTRPRRWREHVRDICVKCLILGRKISEREIGQLVKQWGIPKLFLLSTIDIASLKDEELKEYFSDLRKRLEKLISRTPDEEVVEVLIAWGVSASMLRHTTGQGSTFQAVTSHTQPVQAAELEAYGSKLATETPMSSESQTTPCLSDSHELSFPSYQSKASPSTNPVDIPLSGAGTQALLDSAFQFIFGQGDTAPFSFGQDEMYPWA